LEVEALSSSRQEGDSSGEASLPLHLLGLEPLLVGNKHNLFSEARLKALRARGRARACLEALKLQLSSLRLRARFSEDQHPQARISQLEDSLEDRRSSSLQANSLLSSVAPELKLSSSPEAASSEDKLKLSLPEAYLGHLLQVKIKTHYLVNLPSPKQLQVASSDKLSSLKLLDSLEPSSNSLFKLKSQWLDLLP